MIVNGTVGRLSEWANAYVINRVDDGLNNPIMLGISSSKSAGRFISTRLQNGYPLGFRFYDDKIKDFVEPSVLKASPALKDIGYEIKVKHVPEHQLSHTIITSKAFNDELMNWQTAEFFYFLSVDRETSIRKTGDALKRALDVPVLNHWYKQLVQQASTAFKHYHLLQQLSSYGLYEGEEPVKVFRLNLNRPMWTEIIQKCLSARDINGQRILSVVQ